MEAIGNSRPIRIVEIVLVLDRGQLLAARACPARL
jgi:hypothetical protein